MKIQVLGSGCPTCKNLFEIVQKAATEMGVKEKVEYLTGPKGTQALIEMGIIQSPVLAINGEPVMTGFTPDIEKIKRIIAKNVKVTAQASKCSCGGKC